MLKTSYSNSAHDEQPGEAGLREDEATVRRMYEMAPYPDLGAALKSIDFFFDPIREDLLSRQTVNFLDVGCGTGHVVVGVAKKYSDWNCYGIDLSSASLGIARKLAKQHGVSVTLERGSYLDPLPFDCGKFDVISATGTIHHAADPFAAMRVLREALRDNGWLFLHLYGWRNDAIKFDIKEMLSIFQPDLAQHQERFELYRTLIGHRRSRIKHRIATTTLADLYALVRNALRNVLRRRKGESWSPGWDADYPVLDSPWIDHFCHPCERAYEVAEVQELAEETGFHVMHMLKQGKERPHLIPPKWQSKYDQLDDWSKWRLSELLSDGGGSFAVILKRA